MRVLVLYAHPGQRHSVVNKSLANIAATTEGVTFVDLYAEYPRLKINIDQEQDRLLAHDAIVLQFPLFWYSTPAILKEWQDLVLEYGFAYGKGGTALEGKVFAPAITTGGAEDAYRLEGKNHFPIRALLAPLEQTANLCGMTFLAPLTLYSALAARDDGRGEAHQAAYRTYLEALRDDRLDIEAAHAAPELKGASLPIKERA